MLRIVGGTWGGRRIQAPPGRHTRPTPERVREALFSRLEHQDAVAGAGVLDLYAGSGALGIEALSRGAAHATFVESHGRTAGLIRRNLTDLAIPDAQWAVTVGKAEPLLRTARPKTPWRLVLMDPPYAAGEYARVLPLLASLPAVATDALIAVETAAGAALPPADGLEQIRADRYGDTQVILLRKQVFSAPGPGAEQP